MKSGDNSWTTGCGWDDAYALAPRWGPGVAVLANLGNLQRRDWPKALVVSLAKMKKKKEKKKRLERRKEFGTRIK